RRALREDHDDRAAEDEQARRRPDLSADPPRPDVPLRRQHGRGTRDRAPAGGDGGGARPRARAVAPGDAAPRDPGHRSLPPQGPARPARVNPEDRFVDGLRALLPAGGPVVVGPGDDAAVLERAPGPLVATTDMLVEGVDFLVSEEPERLGRRAAAVNLS